MTDWAQAEYKGKRVFIKIDSKTREVIFTTGRLCSMIYDAKKPNPKEYSCYVGNVVGLPSDVIVPQPLPPSMEGDQKQQRSHAPAAKPPNSPTRVNLVKNRADF
jgi:hypothetical protein